MNQAVILHGDAIEQLRTLPAESVQCVVTSPPYFGLRDYGTGQWNGGDDSHDHDTVGARNGRGGSGTAGKQTAGSFPSEFAAAECSCGATRIDRQIGLESTPAEYVTKMVDVFREVRRVLRKDGVCWLNIGDSYAGGGTMDPGSHTGLSAASERCDGRPRNAANKAAQNGSVGAVKRERPIGLKPKDLIGIPWRLAFALQQPYYTGQIKDERDRVWLAAIIDGEGCFFIHKRKAGESAYSKFRRADGQDVTYKRTADTYGVGLEICNTSKALIDRVQALIPLGTMTTQGPEQNDRRKQTIYRWRVAPNETKRIAQELYPHLVAKQHQARLIFNCPSNGDAGAAVHQAMKDLHNGISTAVDYPPPPALFELGWYLRQDVIWAKPAPMPESVTDRCTKAHEYIFLLSKSERYFYDANAISEQVTDSTIERLTQPNLDNQVGSFRVPGKTNGPMKAVGSAHMQGTPRNDGDRWRMADGGVAERGTRNKRSVWTITTEPYPEAHFATFPTELPRICILAGSKLGDTILDPFAGSGTTLQVALELSRAAIGIELNDEYVALANRRLNSTTLGLPLEIAA